MGKVITWLAEFMGGKLLVTLGKLAAINWINGLIWLSQVVMAGAFVTICIFFYNQFHSLLIDLKDFMSRTDNEIVYIAVSSIKSLGIWGAFTDSFTLFIPEIMALIVIFVSRVFIKVLMATRQWIEDVTRLNFFP